MTMNKLAAVGAATILIALCGRVEAKPSNVTAFCGDRYCSGAAAPAATPMRHRNERRVSRSAGQIVAHPAGCPRRLFCGCGSWAYIKGEVITRGGPAQSAWWRRFPTAAAGPRMAEVRPGHVRIIIEAHGDGTATFYDPNSGGHLTRIHRDRIRGRVVNPS